MIYNGVAADARRMQPRLVDGLPVKRQPTMHERGSPASFLPVLPRL
jgi:hypothetical protein